jgi:hypothetical protein
MDEGQSASLETEAKRARQRLMNLRRIILGY